MTSSLVPRITLSLQYGVYSEREEFAPTGANSFIEELTPIQKGDKNGNSRVASVESSS